MYLFIILTFNGFNELDSMRKKKLKTTKSINNNVVKTYQKRCDSVGTTVGLPVLIVNSK